MRWLAFSSLYLALMLANISATSTWSEVATMVLAMWAASFETMTRP